MRTRIDIDMDILLDLHGRLHLARRVMLTMLRRGARLLRMTEDVFSNRMLLDRFDLFLRRTHLDDLFDDHWRGGYAVFELSAILDRAALSIRYSAHFTRIMESARAFFHGRVIAVPALFGREGHAKSTRSLRTSAIEIECHAALDNAHGIDGYRRGTSDEGTRTLIITGV